MKKKNESNLQLGPIEGCDDDERLHCSPKAFTYLNSWHPFMQSLHFHFHSLSFYLFTPGRPVWAAPFLVPSDLGLKPEKASFPCSKSSETECVWEAVFEGRVAEIGLDQQQEWRLQEGGLWPPADLVDQVLNTFCMGFWDGHGPGK